MAELDQWFDSFNRKYFRDRLPKIDVRWYVESPKEDIGSCYIHFNEDGIDEKKSFIGINPEYRSSLRVCLIYLLHEMVHWKLRKHFLSGCNAKKDHGYIFNREMKRLASMGAFVGLW
jgi:hypothetical protein